MSTLSPDAMEAPQMPAPAVASAPAMVPSPQFAPPTAPVAPKKKAPYREWLNNAELAEDMHDNVVGALEGKEVSNATHRLRIHNVEVKRRSFGPNDEKQAASERGTLHHPIVGSASLYDSAGNQLGTKRMTLGYLPHLTGRGTFVVNGTNYVVVNQSRLLPGVYHRQQGNGNVEAQFNIAPKTGRGFRIGLEPQTGLFKVRVGQSETKLYPLLRKLGVSDDTLKKAWGEDLFRVNYSDKDTADRALAQFGLQDKNDDEIKKHFHGMEVDPIVMGFTQGRKIKTLDNQALIDATANLLKINRKERNSDDRDSPAFQGIHGPEDLLAERVRKDSGGALRKALWKAAAPGGGIDKIPTALFRDSLYSLFHGSGLAQAVEDVNPLETMDTRLKLTSLGEGGLSDTSASPREARGVKPGHLGLIDPLKAPEGMGVGLDMRIAHGTFKGRDNRMYVSVYPKESFLQAPEQRKPIVIPAHELLAQPIAFPGELESTRRKVRAMVDGKIRYVNRKDVGHWLPSTSGTFTASTNLVPFISADKAQRVSMGARMLTQALPLAEREAPLVQPTDDDGTPFVEKFGKHAGAARAEVDGTVMRVYGDKILVRGNDGEQHTVPLYQDMPFNRKTGLHQTPVVKAGQTIRKGDLLATSNYTDDKGHLALGRNLRVGYLAHEGNTFEDAAAISESVAKRMRSDHYYRFSRDVGDATHATTLHEFRGMFPSTYTGQQLGNMDDQGIAKKGTVLKKGDPIVLHVEKREPKGISAITKKTTPRFIDSSETWDHDDPAEVVDVYHRKDGSAGVVLKSMRSLQVGDKLSGYHGNKGVISTIIPDDQMPHTADGKPLEILLSPTGLVSRVNPAQMAEAALGKVAEKTGIPYKVKGFSKNSLVDFAIDELKKHGLSDTETVIDPSTGRRISGVTVGKSHFLRLHHLAEDKLAARELDDYTSEDTPAKGGPTGAKRVAMMDVAALLSAGATSVLRDAKLVRGQRNDAYWKAVRLGYQPQIPQTSVASKKFFNQLKAAGINVEERDGSYHLRPMTDAHTDELTNGRQIQHGETLGWNDMNPRPGGLFDVGATGGVDGTLWSHYKLPHAIPNPIMEEPIRRILGLTGAKLRGVLSGEEELFGKTGPEALRIALQHADANLDKDIVGTKAKILSSSRGARDDAVKKLGFLMSLKKMNIKPSDLLISKVPILPPRYRPISRLETANIVADPNYLYSDLISATENYNKAKELFGDKDAHKDILHIYDAVKAVSGLGDPVSKSLQEKGVKGLLKAAVGIGRSPKLAAFQRKVLSSPVDLVGRGVIVPNANLRIDHVGLPEEMAWNIFRPFVMRKLVQRGMPATQAVDMLQRRAPQAMAALHDVMKERPVIYTRAPSLHRHNELGGFARLVKGSQIQLSPAIEKGMNADHDGDAINVHVPATDDAVEDVKNKLMPSKNLLAPSTFKAHMTPENEFAHGIYLAGSKTSKDAPRYFKDEQAALQAYLRGEITITTPIRIAPTGQ